MSAENKYYLFDSGIVSRAENAKLTQGKVEKIVTNAAWVDQNNWTPESGIPDWEQRVSIMYPNVEYDEENKKYKMWYHALHTDSPVDDYRWRDNLIDKSNSKNVDLGDFVNTARGMIRKGHDVLCYMESTDGINWVRPELGEYFYKNRQGEIVGTNIAYIGMHGLGVHKNENPAPKEPKYLMAGRTWDTDSLDERGEPIGVAISYSEDGIHWEAPITIKTAYDCAPDIYYVRADTHNQLFWSAERNKYVVITRGYSNLTADTRVVAYMESTQELASIRILKEEKCGEKYWEKTAKYWTTPQIVLDEAVTANAQPYSMPIAHLAEGCYVGVVSVADFDRNSKGIWNSVHAELTWSRDGKDWNYMKKGNPFIPNAPQFALERGNDYGMIYCAAPVNVGDHTEILYAALPELHYVKYDHIPADVRQVVEEKFPNVKEKRIFTRTSTLNIARFPKDRYAGYAGEDGCITTTLFEILGSKLTITADIEGCAKIEILDARGNTLSGYEAILKNSVTDQVLEWNGKDLAALKGQKAALRIHLQNACVYTIGGEISYVQ